MRKEDLIPVIAKYDPILANAVSRMVDYIQDRWAAPYPSKEQTEAVNAYLRSVHADGGGTMSETDIAHRRIATQKITIITINSTAITLFLCSSLFLSHFFLDCLIFAPKI